MSTHSFEGITPPARFDNVAWTLVRVEQATPDDPTGPFTEVAALAIPIDASPAFPDPINITVTTATLDVAYFRFRFDVAPSNPSPYTDAILSPPAFGATYTTPSSVRAELGVDIAALGDTQAGRLIADAEDVIDGMLGAWWTDETTGRKLNRGLVDEWQWAKLDRATAKMAAAIYRDPQLLTRREYSRIKGPDFEREGPRGSVAANGSIIALLDASGLRRLTGRAVPYSRSVHRPDYDRFLAATRHDGT